MLENENLVAEATENVEQTTEKAQVETPVEKTYTQSELDDIVGKRLARNSIKIRNEYDKAYVELENVLRAGTGKESVEEMGKGKCGIDYALEPSIYEASNRIRLIYLIDRCRIPLSDNRKNRRIKKLMRSEPLKVLDISN